ncbi:hypothetical protein JTB14_012049 [Gonioctena quinquepunctata]|nr:hypothetical protein JTB14_012049 [Gonioctena quinquepunctata]
MSWSTPRRRTNFHKTRGKEKPEEKIEALKIMPNVWGPSIPKRAVLAGVIHSILLHGVPVVWAEAEAMWIKKGTKKNPTKSGLSI